MISQLELWSLKWCLTKINNGVTKCHRAIGSNKRKRVTVYLKDSLTAVWLCFMLENADKIHGGEYVNHIKETRIKRCLKNFAMELVIPNPMCIYKTYPCSVPKVNQWPKRIIFYQRCKRNALLEETAIL